MPATRTRSTTPAELAEQLGVSQRRIRRITRKLGLGVGRGARYALKAADVKRIKKELS